MAAFFQKLYLLLERPNIYMYSALSLTSEKNDAEIQIRQIFFNQKHFRHGIHGERKKMRCKIH